MAESLAAAFFSSNRNRNLATPGDTISFSFNDPPASATNVLVSVLETVVFLDTAKATVTDRPIGGFRGRIVKKVFIADSILGAPLPSIPDPVTLKIAASLDPAAPHLFAHMPEPEQVQSHTFRLRVDGTFNGSTVRVENASPISMEYPLAMIVVKPPSPNDPSAAVVESWAVKQWLAHKPAFRHVERISTTRFSRAPKFSDYAEMIAAFKVCAKFATSGVVALAVGHGDGGETNSNSIAWCMITPEDFKPNEAVPGQPLAPFPYHLDIDESDLSDGATKGSFPVGTTQLKLDVLDKLAEALEGSGIRRILLHTCKAGKSVRFMQMFADRIRVPLLAHIESIEYTGVAGSGNILAGYAGTATISPRDLRHWPVYKMAGPFMPGPAPKKFGPPPP